MSDEMSLNQPAMPQPTQPKKGFLGTTAGKIVAIVVALGVLGTIVGIAGLLILQMFGEKVVEELGNQAQPPASSSSTTPTATVEPKAPAADIPNSDVFTFRDIFEPLLKETTTSSETNPTGDALPSTETSDSITPMESGVLYLVNILGYSNGVAEGLFYYNNQQYELGPGEAIPGTPWQVLRISSTGVVTMLYGDVQVTITVGQGIRK